MSGALLGLVCVALAAAYWRVAIADNRKPDRAYRAWLTVGVLAAPVLLIGCLIIAWAGARTGDLRLTLQKVTAEVRQFPMTLGGDAARDDLVIPRLPAAVAAIGPDLTTASDNPPLALTLAGSDATPPQVVIALRRGRELSYPTALPFADGDAVCVVAPCEQAGAAWAALRGRTLVSATWRDGRVFADPEARAGLAIPGRKTLLALQGVNEWTPAQAIHPLRDLFPRERTPAADGVQTDCDRWLCAGRGAQRAPVRSFLFQSGGFRGGAWSIVLADPGARVARAGVGQGLEVAPYHPPPPIRLGEPVEARLMEPRFVDTVAGPDARLGHLQTRRSLILAEADGLAEITFVTPPTEVVGRCGAGGEAKRAMTGGAVLGGLTAEATREAPPAPEGPACIGFTRASFEVPVTAGASLRTVRLALDRLATPWPLALIALAWAATLLAAARHLFARRPALWALLCLLQLLLALRLLIGLAAAAADPSLDWREILSDGAIAYVAAPAALLAWARWGEPRRAEDWLLDLAPLASAAVALTWTHRLSVLSLLVLTAWLASAVWGRLTAPAPGGAKLSRAQQLREAAEQAVARLRSRRALWASGAVLLTATIAARLVIGALGWKERIDLGVTVLAISVVYTPLLLLGFARLLAASEARPEGWLRPAAFWLLLVLATFAAPFMVRDSGYALMFLPIAGFAAWLAWRRGQARLAWIAPAALALAALIALPLAGALGAAHAGRLGLPPQMQSGLTDDEALAALDRQAETGQNLLRLYLVAAPEALGVDASTEAESLKVWSAQLADYAGSLWGRGYLTPANLTALRPVQATDNVTAVHLMSPFGRLATGLLLALLAAAPAAITVITRGATMDARRITGLLALWSVFGAAFYMTLANLQLAPFTGRNAYLLAPTSGGDLLEGTILFLLAAWGLAGPPASRIGEARR